MEQSEKIKLGVTKVAFHARTSFAVLANFYAINAAQYSVRFVLKRFVEKRSITE